MGWAYCRFLVALNSVTDLMAAAKEKVSIGHFDGHATSREAVGKLRVVRECENRLTEFLKNVLQLPSAMPKGANLDRPSSAWTYLYGHDQPYLRILVSFKCGCIPSRQLGLSEPSNSCSALL